MMEGVAREGQTGFDAATGPDMPEGLKIKNFFYMLGLSPMLILLDVGLKPNVNICRCWA